MRYFTIAGPMPLIVNRAIKLLWGSLLLNMPIFIGRLTAMEIESDFYRITGALVAALLGYGLPCWLLIRLSAGCNSSRWAYLIVCLAGLPKYVSGFQSQFAPNSLTTLLLLISWGLVLVALILLFTRTSSIWFKTRLPVVKGPTAV